MRKFLLIGATGIFALAVGGCSGSGSDTASPTPTPSATSASPAAKVTPKNGASPSPINIAQAFPSPVVTPKSNDIITATGLIQSTNPDERAKQAQSDINGKNRLPSAPLTPQVTAPNESVTGDPFSVLAPQTIKSGGDSPVTGGKPEPPKLENRQIPNLPKLPEFINPPQWKPKAAPAGTPGGTRPGIPQLPNQQGTGISTLPKLPIGSGLPQWKPQPRNRPGVPGSPSSPSIPSIPSIPPGSSTQLPSLPKLPIVPTPPAWRDPNPPPSPGARPGTPPPPSTDIAQAIEISGVVKVGNEIFVIAKAPSEATSRYVKVGQRIANGQVLIKRVVFKPGEDPVVILEENGVEVSKIVGEKPPEPDKKPG